MLGAQLNRMWGGEFISGVMDAASQNDVNVVCFIGGKPTVLNTPEKNTSYGLYDLIKTEQFDGILFSADIAHGLTPDEIKKFSSTFAPIPITSFAVPSDNISTFATDSETGMRSIVRHLIEAHQYQKIAFIRGIPGQVEAEQRFRAYKDELRTHNIPFDENLVVYGDFTPESGRAAIRTLLDERGVKMQAIVASNDRMAFGAMEALQLRGIQVPDSIALTGFDDVSEAQSTGVPLTTVHQSFYDAGVKAFTGLMQRMNGEVLPPATLLPSQMVVRWSCGCLPESVTRAVVLSKEVAQTGRLENKRDAAIRALFGAAGILENDSFKDQFRDVFGRTWDVFLASLQETDKSDAFLKMIQSSIEVLQRHGYEFTTWNNVLSTFRKYALGGISSNTTMLRAENLFQQARMLAGELSQRAQAYRRLQFEQLEEALSNFSFSMAPAMTFDEIGDAISKHFPALGLERWYVMFYSDFTESGTVSSGLPESYRLLMQYDNNNFKAPNEKSAMATGRLVPRGKTPEERRYTAIVMPLTLASNRFGFMWAEVGPKDWDVYVRVRNLLSSALLRTMLVDQREQAQKEVVRLLSEARERAAELARAKEVAEKAATQNANLFEAEQARRRGAEALARSSRQLSSLTTADKLPQQIMEQLRLVLEHDRGILFMEDVNGVASVRSFWGLPTDTQIIDLNLKIGNNDLYQIVTQKREAILINDIDAVKGWTQPDWMPKDRSWLGVPLFLKNKVIGMLILARQHGVFNQDDLFAITTFATQATVALENSRLYDEVTGINQMMERMVSQRVEELNNAYTTLAKHDTNKSAFIQVAAHELRTPLTVIKGYLGILKSDPNVLSVNALSQAVDGVSQGTNRLQQVVNSMLDVARLDNQIVNPHVEPVSLSLILRLIHKDYVKDLALRNLTVNMDDEKIKEIPPVMADPELLKKALDHVFVNAIKFTPDSGNIFISVKVVEDSRLGKCAELAIKDTGIGIDAEHHKIIFEKLYQLGKVELHSSSRTNYKGGGAGLGLAIASGIIKALHGTIWVESTGHDEVNFPGSTFFVRLPVMKS
ncbi:MAG: substrate-binding domain-containing protein [Anaerolineales bacterium]